MLAKTVNYRILSVIAICALMSACNTMQLMKTGDLTGDFDESFRLYAKHLRWSHFREITLLMVPERVAPALKKADLYKERRVTAVKPISWVLNEEDGTMTGNVIIDYYAADRGVVRSTTQYQIWRRNNETWQLDSDLPDLK